jgi:hypothetical protein
LKQKCILTLSPGNRITVEHVHKYLMNLLILFMEDQREREREIERERERYRERERERERERGEKMRETLPSHSPI